MSPLKSLNIDQSRLTSAATYMKSPRMILIVAAILATSFMATAVEPSKVIALWPNGAPGEKGNIGEEANITKPKDRMVAGKPVARIGNVSNPTISICPASADKNTGTAALVFPGGAYNIVAADLEGSEVCEWLNSIGVTAILLKYRVPRREGLEKHFAPLQDAQRAMSLVRSRAAELKIDPKKIGVVGFSAGGHLAAALCSSVEKRIYPNVDAADSVNLRPDFALLIYPAYLVQTNDLHKLSPEVAVSTNHPPTFVVMTEDDGLHVENVLTYYRELKQAKVPAELHVYPNGGHGYGLRPTEFQVTTWPLRAEAWLRNRELIPRN